jgi:twitching motility protein PilT
MEAILREGLARGASDLHLKVRQRPVLRVQGQLVVLDEWPELAQREVEALATALMQQEHHDQLARTGAVDLPHSVPGVGRFRATVCKARGSFSVALRVIPHEVPTIEALHLPAVVAKLAMEPRGLVLVTGPAGSGKTTTLAAMVRHMNEHRRDHIVTIEDPIEYLHEDRRSIITQREVGVDTPSFLEALRVSLRQDPNVIMVGEMRDAETIRTVLTLAETGHLVLSTLHTITAAETVNRLVAEFPGEQERQIRRQLAQVLRGIVSQRLVESKDGAGRLPVVEVLVGTKTVQQCIEDPARTNQLAVTIAEGHAIYGMQTFDQCALGYYQQGLITYEEALRASTSPTNFEVEVQRLSMTPASKRPAGPATGRMAQAVA